MLGQDAIDFVERLEVAVEQDEHARTLLGQDARACDGI